MEVKSTTCSTYILHWSQHTWLPFKHLKKKKLLGKIHTHDRLRLRNQISSISAIMVYHELLNEPFLQVGMKGMFLTPIL